MTNRAVMQDLLIEPLSADQVAAVFPLMRSADPTLSPAVWKKFARRAIGGAALAPQGVLVARRPALKFPSGAVCYRRHRDLNQAAVLTAEHFIALDLLYPELIIGALIAGLEPMARRLGCTTIRSIVHGSAEILISTLQSQGHIAEAVTMTKPVTSAVPRNALLM